MSKEKTEAWKSMNEEVNKEKARETWDSWLDELKEKDQPEACSIDNPDCENCGS